MSKVAIEIDSKWVKIVRSPVYFVVVALQAISISFAPLDLYWIGKAKGKSFPGFKWITLPLCYGGIFFAMLFYLLLGNAVIRELRQRSAPRARWVFQMTRVPFSPELALNSAACPPMADSI